jgi:hypothetical protein
MPLHKSVPHQPESNEPTADAQPTLPNPFRGEHPPIATAPADAVGGEF